MIYFRLTGHIALFVTAFRIHIDHLHLQNAFASPSPHILHHFWKLTIPIAFWDNVDSDGRNGCLWLAISLRKVYGFLSLGSKGALYINGGQEANSLVQSDKNTYHSRFCSTIETQLEELHLHLVKNTATDSRTAKKKKKKQVQVVIIIFLFLRHFEDLKVPAKELSYLLFLVCVNWGEHWPLCCVMLWWLLRVILSVKSICCWEILYVYYAQVIIDLHF